MQITTNFVQSTTVNERSEIVLTPTVLSTVMYGAKHGYKSTIGLKNQNFFTVNNPKQQLEIDFKTVDTEVSTEGASVFVLFLLRRVR